MASGWPAPRGDAGRPIDVRDIGLPQGFRLEPVATGLTYPTAVVVDEQNRVYVVESGYGCGVAFATPRLIRLDRGGRRTVIAEGVNGPWTGACAWKDAIYVSEGSPLTGGRILRISLTGTVTPIIDGLPSVGDHPTDRPLVSPDGWLYFGQGSATNSGVVGEDSARLGWLHRFPEFHDIPARDVVLAGENFETRDPITSSERVTTGAYVAFGSRTHAGQRVPGHLPATGAIMRLKLDATGFPVTPTADPRRGALELVAWGFRNPFGLAFAPDGRLFATDSGMKDRGSRPVPGAVDFLHAVKPGGTWYGWPDFVGSRPITDPQFQTPGGAQLHFLLAEHPPTPPDPIASLGVRASCGGLDFSRGGRFCAAGDAFVAEFGELVPEPGQGAAPTGFRVVRVNVKTGRVEDFAVNLGVDAGPASRSGTGGLERPIDVRFDNTGDALYIVDFGIVEATEFGPAARRGSGVLWKVTRAPHEVAVSATD